MKRTCTAVVALLAAASVATAQERMASADSATATRYTSVKVKFPWVAVTTADGQQGSAAFDLVSDARGRTTGRITLALAGDSIKLTFNVLSGNWQRRQHGDGWFEEFVIKGKCSVDLNGTTRTGRLASTLIVAGSQAVPTPARPETTGAIEYPTPNLSKPLFATGAINSWKLGSITTCEGRNNELYCSSMKLESMFEASK